MTLPDHPVASHARTRSSAPSLPHAAVSGPGRPRHPAPAPVRHEQREPEGLAEVLRGEDLADRAGPVDGAVTAGVKPGSTVYIAGAGPVGMAAAASARLLGAAVTIVGDMNEQRLAHARAMGFETVNLSLDASLGEQIEQILGKPEVDCAVDCVGFKAHGHGNAHTQEAPATVLNSLMEITRAAGAIGIPGLYVTDDPGSKDAAARRGSLSLRLGLGWAKSHSFHTGQTPVMKYNRNLMQAILWDRLPIADIVNVTVISLDQAPEGYREFDGGAPRKFVIDPHGMLEAA